MFKIDTSKIDKVDTFMLGIAIAGAVSIFTNAAVVVGIELVIVVFVTAKIYFIRQAKKKAGWL